MEKTKKISGKVIAIIVAAVVIALGLVGIIVVKKAKEDNKSYRVIKIHQFEGQLTMKRGGETTKPAKGMNLKKKDDFSLQAAASMELLADSDKHVKALENTDFYISKVGNENSGKLQFQLTKGTLLVDIENKLEDDEEFEIVTPNAITSVRGTVFSVTYYPEVRMSEISVDKGVVEVKSSNGKERVKAGEKVYVLSNDEIVTELPEDYFPVPNGPENPEGNKFIAPSAINNPIGEWEPQNKLKYASFTIKGLEGWNFNGNYGNNFHFSNDKYRIIYTFIEGDTEAERLYVSDHENEYVLESNEVVNSDGDNILIEYWNVDNFGSLVGLVEVDLYKKYDNITLRITLANSEVAMSYDEVDIDELIKLTGNDRMYIGLQSPEGTNPGQNDPEMGEPVPVDPNNPIQSGQLSEDDMPAVLINGNNYSQLLYCIRVMQGCALSDNENYVKSALNQIWYTSKMKDVYQPISTTGGNSYSVAELNAIFALMGSETIGGDNLPMTATLTGDTLKYRVCDVSAGGSTGISDVSYVIEGDKIVVSYSFRKTDGSDGMSGTTGTGRAIVGPNQGGKYVIEKIETLTQNKFNY